MIFWRGRSKTRSPEMEQPHAAVADGARIGVASSLAGERPRLSVRPITLPEPVTTPAPGPEAATDTDAKITGRISDHEEGRGEPVRPVSPGDRPKFVTTALPQAPHPVGFTSGRDAYFQTGGYVAAEQPRIPMTPAVVLPASRKATPLSIRLPWDEIILMGFPSGSVERSSEHSRAIADLASALVEILKDYPDTFASVVGHADRSEASAESLGQQRADGVLGDLLALGVRPRVMHAASMGCDVPVNTVPGHEAHNRRVVVRVIKRNFQADAALRGLSRARRSLPGRRNLVRRSPRGPRRHRYLSSPKSL